MATPKGIETRKRNELIRRFGTSDVLEILGPAGTIPPTQSIGSRLAELGYTDKHIDKWASKYIPFDLYAQLKPLQAGLSVKSRLATCQAKYGGNSPMCSKATQAKAQTTCLLNYGVTNPMHSDIVLSKHAATCIAKYGSTSPRSNAVVKAKAEATNLARYGGNPTSLTPSEILERLAAYDLEPIEPIVYNSDKHREIRVRCKHCGREFTTHWINNNSRGYHGAGLIACCCDGFKSKLEEWLSQQLKDLGYTVISTKPDWMPSRHKGQNLEIDLYCEALKVGIELNGFIAHSSTPTRFGCKESDFHAYKSDCALRHGVKLYHFWYARFSQDIKEAALDFCLAALNGVILDLDDNLQADRDTLPDPSVIGLPYADLGPQPFTDPEGRTCYTSGLWQFYAPEKSENQNGTSAGDQK